ncbi:MAG: amidase, partial [Planctomycetota bacterium]
MNEILELSILELREKIAAGDLSAVEVTRTYLEAIGKIEDKISALNEVLDSRALEQAKRIDAKISAGELAGPLGGVPLAVKDNLCTPYGKTTCSSKILADFRAPYTATAVEKLESAGAVIIAKTNMDEFAMGSSTETSAFKPARNPWDTGRVPGGSSGGSAAAVAARLCTGALGSDTGGSIRQPAAFCGVVGFKPTYGRISRYGLVAYGSSLDQIGPITRDVKDCALLTQLTAGRDGRDSTSLGDEVADYLAEIDTPIEKLRVGLPKEFYSDALDPQINTVIHAA